MLKIVLTAAVIIWYNILAVEKNGIAAVVSDTTRKGVLPMQEIALILILVFLIIVYIKK